jgi:secreted PhoX family phosphatase
MSTVKADKTLNRRGFLKGIGTGAAGAATAVVGTGAATPAVAVESTADKKKLRYRETEHVKKFYATNRY